MYLKRLSAPLFLTTALIFSGCQKADTPPPADNTAKDTPSPKEAPAATNNATAKDTAVPANDAGASDKLVSNKVLKALVLPKPKGAPDAGSWRYPDSGDEGAQTASFGVGSFNDWITLDFRDCNMPALKRLAANGQQGLNSAVPCLNKPNGKLAGYPLFNSETNMRSIRVGHIGITARIGSEQEGKGTVKPEDLEAVLQGLDLAAISRL